MTLLNPLSRNQTFHNFKSLGLTIFTRKVKSQKTKFKQFNYFSFKIHDNVLESIDEAIGELQLLQYLNIRLESNCTAKFNCAFKFLMLNELILLLATIC